MADPIRPTASPTPQTNAGGSSVAPTKPNVDLPPDQMKATHAATAVVLGTAELKVQGKSLGFYRIPKDVDVNAMWVEFTTKFAKDTDRTGWPDKFAHWISLQTTALKPDPAIKNAPQVYNFG